MQNYLVRKEHKMLSNILLAISVLVLTLALLSVERRVDRLEEALVQTALVVAILSKKIDNKKTKKSKAKKGE